MKFLITTGNFPPDVGGPSVVIVGLVNELRDAGHEVTVVVYGEGESSGGVIRVSRAGSMLQRYGRFAAVIRKSLTSDMAVLATDVFSVGIPTRFALIGRTNPLVLRLGGEWCWEDAVTNGGLRVTLRQYWASHATGLRHRLKAGIVRWILKRAKRVAVTSDLLSEILRPLVPGTKFVTVPNRYPLQLPLKGREHDPLRLFYVGRFAPVKNLVFFARVLKRLHVEGIAVECIFGGDGPDLPEVQAILEDVPGVRFLGKIKNEESLRQLASVDLHVLPSLSDICPNTVVEALACGVPCLITREHGLPRPLSGIIELDPQDEAAWVEAIRSLRDPAVYETLRNSVRPVGTNAAPSLIDVLTA